MCAGTTGLSSPEVKAHRALMLSGQGHWKRSGERAQEPSQRLKGHWFVLGEPQGEPVRLELMRKGGTREAAKGTEASGC